MRLLCNHYAFTPTTTTNISSDRVTSTSHVLPPVSRLGSAEVSDKVIAGVFEAPIGMDELELKLPLEIVEVIIRAVDDSRDLKACALSCSYLRQVCQRRLFQNLRIDCDNDETAFLEGGLVYTIARTDRHVEVLSLIRWLRIENQYGGLGGQGGMDQLLGRFLTKLVALEALELRGAGLDWTRRELVGGLISVLQLPMLRELRLARLERFPLPLLLWGRALQKVGLENVLFMRSATSGPEVPLVLPSLAELKMDNRGMGLSIFGLHLLSSVLGRGAFTNLKKLHLEYRDREGDRPDDINRLLSVCQSSLEDLVLLLTHDAYSSAQLYATNIRLSRLTNLRCFSTRIYITTRDGYLEEEHPFNFLRLLLCECSPTLESIHLLCFHRFGDVGDPNAPEASGWTELDNVLTSMLGLREVSVVVCCTQCTLDQRAAHEGVYDLPMVRAREVGFQTRFTDNINTALEEWQQRI
ncbi:hypothetical protein NP233_g9313 [Leucocoprinus birnbaumii]|uniref:F-box domain-containing protein n=1 Tax=Leucocoprinus birnbaumii TaxID=56174 RepID=A0AAD5VKT0_9AGAR|nr:hypothetical protein NP233_g9313 [Leucocoprinus birnbaumii]